MPYAPTIEQLPVRIPGRALAAAIRDYPAPDADAPLTSAAEAAGIFTKFQSIFAAADKCPCCGKPKPGSVFGYDNPGGAL